MRDRRPTGGADSPTPHAPQAVPRQPAAPGSARARRGLPGFARTPGATVPSVRRRCRSRPGTSRGRLRSPSAGAACTGNGIAAAWQKIPGTRRQGNAGPVRHPSSAHSWGFDHGPCRCRGTSGPIFRSTPGAGPPRRIAPRPPGRAAGRPARWVRSRLSFPVARKKTGPVAGKAASAGHTHRPPQRPAPRRWSLPTALRWQGHPARQRPARAAAASAPAPAPPALPPPRRNTAAAR
jgi:hypothetical protein